MTPAADDPTWEEEQARLRSLAWFYRGLGTVVCVVALVAVLNGA